MPRISFEGDVAPIEVEEGSFLLDAMLARNVNAKMLCGRRGLCATCHVFVDADSKALSARTQREEHALLMLTGARDNSRLACQTQVLGDDIRIAMPEGLYVESLSEIESLIGKRSNVPILHPITGDVLVEANKIIVRSLIMKLSDTDFEIADLAIHEPMNRNRTA